MTTDQLIPKDDELARQKIPSPGTSCTKFGGRLKPASESLSTVFLILKDLL